MEAMAGKCETLVETQAGQTPADGAIGLLTSQFERFYRTVYGYLLHRLFDRELAEELAAQTFCQAAAHQRRLHGNAQQVQFWLLRTATRLANTHFRRARLHRFLLGRFAWSRPTETLTDGPHSVAQGREVDGIRGTLKALPLRHQSVIVLRFYMEMSFEDIGAVLGCRPEAVRVRLSRAVQEMRRRLGVDRAVHRANQLDGR